MFFTQDDFRKIEQWLNRRGLQDTEFEESVTPFNGKEIITLVQNGMNKKIFMKDFISQLFGLGVSDFLNVSDKYKETYLSIDKAIRLIPYNARKLGQVITFLDTDGNWRIYQFIGESLNQWTHIPLWIDLLDLLVTDGLKADEEDLIEVIDNNKGVVKFANKEYNPDYWSGKGRIYLRKNITVIDGVAKNLLVQSMIAEPNTIYIIQYDYDLNNQTITIPSDCILDFQGGTFNNGTVTLSNTKVPQGCNIADYITSTINGNYKEGQVLYDSSLKKMKLWNGSNWVNLDGSTL